MAKNTVDIDQVVGLIQAMGGADPAVIEAKVQDWLEDHPEATTTVQDGSITLAKLASDVAQKVNAVTQLSDEIVDVKSAFAAMGLVIYNGQFYVNPDGNTLSA